MAKKKSAIEEEVKLELTPMIDVTFLILIFFMCTLKFKTLEGKLVSFLPTDKGLSSAQAQIEQEDAEIAMKVRKYKENGKDIPPLERTVEFYRRGSNTPFGKSLGVVRDGSGRVAGFKLDPPDTFQKIQQYLQEVRDKSPESKAKINAWPRVPHAYVVHILNMMIATNFTDISYSGIPANLMTKLSTGEVK